MARAKLSLAGSTLLGIGAMVSGGIFVLTGIAGEMAGPGAVLAFLLAGVLALLSALSFAELGPALPRAGGPYDFTSEALGPFYGFVTGIMYLLGYVAASASYAIAFGIYLETLVPVAPVWSAVGLLVVLGALNVVAGDAAHALGSGLTLVKAGALVLFVLVGLWFVNVANLQPALPSGLGPVVEATGVLFLTYLGFDIVTTGAEDMEDPERDLHRAVLLSLGIVLVIYLLTSLVTVGIVPRADLGGAALATAARTMGGEVAAGAVSLVALAATASASNATILATSRVTYAMAREGLLPRALERVHERFRTPWLAVLAASGAMVVAGGLGAVLPFTASEHVVVLASVAALTVLLVFAGVNASTVVLRMERPQLLRPFEVPWFPWVPLVAGVVSLLLTLTLAGSAWVVVLVGVGVFTWAYHRVEGLDRSVVVAPFPRAWDALVRASTMSWRNRTTLSTRMRSGIDAIKRNLR